MKRIAEKQGKNSWNHVVGLFAFIHSVVALIVYEVLRFQPCDDGLFPGSCGIGRRISVLTLLVAWVVFSGSFSAIMVYGKRKYGEKIFAVSYIGALLVTAGSVAVVFFSGLILYGASLLP